MREIKKMGNNIKKKVSKTCAKYDLMTKNKKVYLMQNQNLALHQFINETFSKM